MKLSRFTLAAAVLATAAASAQAQTWSTNFDDVAARQGTFGSLTVDPNVPIVVSGGQPTNAFWYVAGGDTALALPDSSTATLSFSTGVTDIPALKVTFWASTTFPTPSSVDLTLTNTTSGSVFTATGLSLNDVVPNTGPNPNPDGQELTWYFTGLGANTSGAYTLTFNNVPQSAGFRIDDVSVSAVPEPSAYALSLLGIGALGVMARRRSAKKA